jgi:hypothetical protein
VVDGIENTIALVETPASKAVPWTKWEDDLPFDPANPFAGIGTIPSDGLHVAMFDGNIRTVRPTASASSFSKFVTWRASYDGAEPAFGPADTTNVFLDWQQPDSAVTSRIKLKSIVLGMHNYADSRGNLPVNTAYGLDLSTQRSYLSWRVHLLPFLGYGDLYNRFHIDEPWNSPHNMTLLDKMPEVFRSRGLSASSTKTAFKVFEHSSAYSYTVSNGSPKQLSGPTFQSFADDTSQTFLVIELLADQAVEWTKPEDIAWDPANPLGGIGTIPVDGLRVITADGGAIVTVRPGVTAANFKAFVTKAGGDLTDNYSVTSNTFFDWQNSRRYENDLSVSGSPMRQLILQQSSDQYYRFNKLKTIMLGMYNYNDVYLKFPVSNGWQKWDQSLTPQNGRPNLSWRVHLLPYLGQQALYNQFRLDEPWNSPHNIQLLDKMPEVFRSRGLPANTTKTGFQLFMHSQAYHYNQGSTYTVNGRTVYDKNGPRINEITDGTSNTIAVIETMPENAVNWTDPSGDIAWDPANPFGNLVLPPDAFLVAMSDGSVKALHPSLAPARFQALVTWRGAEIIDWSLW